METQVLYGEQGTLHIQRWETRVDLTLHVPNDQLGLYRAWVAGDSGERFFLGTLLPQENQLVLHRSLSLAQLDLAHCLPIVSWGMELFHRFAESNLPQGWREQEHPAQFLPPESEFIPLLQQYPKALVCQHAQGVQIALPAAAEAPFPLPVLFCFARLRTLGGKNHWVFPFDLLGKPQLPP